MFHQGAWGTVTDDGWDLDNATVVCRSLGYGGAASAVPWSVFGKGTGKIIFDDVDCDGDEATIFDCSKNGRDKGDRHYADAGVRCRGIMNLLLYGNRISGGFAIQHSCK